MAFIASKRLKKLIFVCFCFWSVLSAEAGNIDTVQVYSPSMQRMVEVVVIYPDAKDELAPLPAVYLLHGYGGNAHNWLSIRPDLPDVAEREKVVFVCPDGKNSWYWDSPRQSSVRYETFVSRELPAYVDSCYHTEKSADYRAITGLSMGGHGALWNALRHPDVFGAAGSMSGGVDIRPFPKSWEMAAQLGEYEKHRAVWDAHTVMTLVDTLEEKVPRLIIDCGEDDFFLDVNRSLHEKLTKKRIPHDFIVRPGAHDAPYWINALDYQLLFFLKSFRRR